jgi:hypothetical protein
MCAIIRFLKNEYCSKEARQKEVYCGRASGKLAISNMIAGSSG